MKLPRLALPLVPEHCTLEPMNRLLVCAVALGALCGCSFGPGWQSSALDPNTRFAVPADTMASAPATPEERCSAQAWRAAAAYPQARELEYSQAFKRCMGATRN